MFNFLKDKLKGAISKFSKNAGDEVEEKPKAEEKVEVKEKSKEIKPIVKEKNVEEKKEEFKVEKKEEVKPKVEENVEKPVKEVKVEEKKEEIVQKEKKVVEPTIEQEEPKVEEPVKEKKGFFKKVTQGITTKKIDETKFEELFWELELALLENNVAVEVIEKIKQDLKENLVGKPLTRTKIITIINDTLKNSIKEILEVDKIDLFSKIKSKKPYVICFIGINGSGKTTTIAKFVKMLQENKLSCVMAASDTFRAAAIDQLQHHADKLEVKLIKQDYGADPAAVAFDAIKHAEAKGIDVVLIDTAGRMHSNSNLIDEMKKIVRVAKPDLKIFVGESITGNDCVEQAKKFNEAVGIDGVILSKADIDEKGGAALSVSYVTKKPIMFIGVGQEYEDLKEFNSDIVLDNLGF